MPIIELKDAMTRSFDYVIIGGGTAGLTLAAGLTENAEISVLVLEAGEEILNDPLINNIGQYGHSLGKKEFIWPMSTVPQVNANDVEFTWSRSAHGYPLQISDPAILEGECLGEVQRLILRCGINLLGRTSTLGKN